MEQRLIQAPHDYFHGDYPQHWLFVGNSVAKVEFNQQPLDLAV